MPICSQCDLINLIVWFSYGKVMIEQGKMLPSLRWIAFSQAGHWEALRPFLQQTLDLGLVALRARNPTMPATMQLLARSYCSTKRVVMGLARAAASWCVGLARRARKFCTLMSDRIASLSSMAAQWNSTRPKSPIALGTPANRAVADFTITCLCINCCWRAVADLANLWKWCNNAMAMRTSLNTNEQSLTVSLSGAAALGTIDDNNFGRFMKQQQLLAMLSLLESSIQTATTQSCLLIIAALLHELR